MADHGGPPSAYKDEGMTMPAGIPARHCRRKGRMEA
jgi:hypothetical protein